MKKGLFALLSAFLMMLGISFTVPIAQATTVTFVPAPTTVAGYQQMWNSLDPNYWGSADVSLSVPMADGRVVWLYGDTMSNYNGMVNSSAITQTGGSLHVSLQGTQLLPPGGYNSLGQKIVYWIEEARAVNRTTIEVTAGPYWIGNLSAWDFGRATVQSRTALVSVNGQGDVRFQYWTGWVDAPVLNTAFLTVADGAPDALPGHLYYGKRYHPEAKLASGKTLVTICQTRTYLALTPSGGIDYSQYMPIFSEE